MRNALKWKPTKVRRAASGFRVSPDIAYLGCGSRLAATLQLRAYQDLVHKFASGRLLDLGCGAVPYYELYKSYITDVVCVDWDNSWHSREFRDYAFDLNEPIPFDSQTFDTVLLTDVLEHIYNPAELLAEVGRLLRPGGYAIIGVPFLYWLHETPYDFYRYTEFALRRLCEASNLRVDVLYAYGGALEVIADVVGKCMVLARHDTAARLVSAAACHYSEWSVAKRISRKTSRAFPFGYALAAERAK